MGATGNFPIDLILFGMIAAFLVLRLRGILGRRTGYERPPQSDAAQPGVPAAGLARAAPTSPVIEGRAEPVAQPGPARILPDPSGPAGAALARMAEVDRSFEPQRFLAGAEAAFRMIVAAFAAGDRLALRPLLTDETYRSFETAVAAREAGSETHRSEIKAMHNVTIDAAELRGPSLADITVRFVSDQISETLGKTGMPVAGTDAVTEIVDLWTFERDLAQSGPAWRLSAVRSG